MLLLSLDEFGDFEGIKQVKAPVFIAGLIFDDNNIAGEISKERERIKAYYQSIIADASDGTELFSYPEALHSDGNASRNTNVVRPVKERVKNSLAEYIQKGTYQGQNLMRKNSQGNLVPLEERKGRYYLFAIIKSDAGKTRLLRESANILSRDDFGSNLYFHMASNLVSKVIFHNPVISDIKEISIDIATRTSANLDRSENLANEYKKLGYKAKQNENSEKIYFELTNSDIYRTIIAEEIMDTDKLGIQISNFKVSSITYKNSAKNQEFLYLADSVCSVLSFQVDGNNGDEWFGSIAGRIHELTDKEDDLIFGYDEIDTYFSKAWEKYEEGDYYKALSIAFDQKSKKGTFAEFYKKKWFMRLESHIISEKNVSDFNMAVRKLYETLNNNTLDSEKCFYILGILEQMIPQIEPKLRTPEAKRILYMLYDIAVTAYCHIGDSKNAERYFDKCTEYARYVGLEEYLNTRNKLVVFCCDYFKLGRAEEIADKNIEYLELMAEVKKEIDLPGMDEEIYLALAKAYSQRAQVYAFQRNGGAEKEFQAALQLYDANSANYKITQSYLMHHYLEMNMENEYLEQAKIYFGNQHRLGEQLKYIIKEGAKHDALINMRYAFYVFLKGIYHFRMHELSNELWTKIKNIEKIFGKEIRNKDWTLKGHPAELIFKYLTLIAIERNDVEAEKIFSMKMKNCLKYQGATIGVILKFGEIECEHNKGNISQRDEMTIQLCQLLKAEFEVFANLEIPDSGEERYQWLCETVCFMFR